MRSVTPVRPFLKQLARPHVCTKTGVRNVLMYVCVCIENVPFSFFALRCALEAQNNAVKVQLTVKRCTMINRMIRPNKKKLKRELISLPVSPA